MVSGITQAAKKENEEVALEKALNRRILVTTRRRVNFFYRGLSHSFNVVEIWKFPVAYQRDGRSFSAHPRGSADAVEVNWRIHGYVVVDYVRDALDV